MSYGQHEVGSDENCGSFDFLSFVERIVAQKGSNVVVKFVSFKILASDLIQRLSFTSVLIKDLAVYLWLLSIDILLITEFVFVLASFLPSSFF